MGKDTPEEIHTMQNTKKVKNYMGKDPNLWQPVNKKVVLPSA